MVSIISLLDERHVFADLEVKTKEELLTTLIASFSDDVTMTELDAIEEAVMQRERIMSTGVGKGLAIPHGKAPEVHDNYAAFATLNTPIDYGAVDDQPVSMIFLLTGPGSANKIHIKLLSRISRLMNDDTFRAKLKQCSSPHEIVDVFKEQEQIYFE
jgi:fructose-specific phosphotransferase system IIA component